MKPIVNKPSLLIALALVGSALASAQDKPPTGNDTRGRDAYTPSSVVTELTMDIAAFLPNDVFTEIRDWEKKVEADGKDAAMSIPLRLLNSMTFEAVRTKLGKEDRITEDEVPGFGYASDPKKAIKGKYLWYGRVGLGFLDADRDPRINAGLALRFVPKKPDLKGVKQGAGSGEVTAKPLSGTTKPSNWPKYSGELAGRMEVRVKNPNDFNVRVGLRSNGNGKDFTVAGNEAQSVRVPNGRYEIYFQYSTDPEGLYQGDSFTLNNNGVEIQIVKVVNGNYGIRKVK